MPVLEGKGDAKYQHQLPTVSFRVITDDKSLLAPAGVHSVSKRPRAMLRVDMPLTGDRNRAGISAVSV
jgi:hypothetical protein